MDGYVRRTKVAVLESCLEKVLSKMSPYMPPWPLEISYVPIDTLSASHFPCHCIKMKPFAFSCSCAVEVSLRAVEFFRSLPIVGSSCSREEVASSSTSDAALPCPGCLNMPKFLAHCQQMCARKSRTSIHGFLMWLNTPGYRVSFVDSDPAYNVRLPSALVPASAVQDTLHTLL